MYRHYYLCLYSRYNRLILVIENCVKITAAFTYSVVILIPLSALDSAVVNYGGEGGIHTPQFQVGKPTLQ